ncbi:hypothetical protein D7Y07_20555 [Bacteroides acidifaciens]|uniref:Uncharacterized protein n=1 Tax=Bacteroides acidifaciens TaxID=85831 RepID=A0A3L8A342_9BACE|nr:hypothetical protein D7Y07_20555 [Bacteroides acidifaciens]
MPSDLCFLIYSVPEAGIASIEPCIPFACFHIQYISPIYCGKGFPHIKGKDSQLLGKVFPQYMGQSEPMGIFKQ